MTNRENLTADWPELAAAQLAEAQARLLDPTAAGVSACIPYLEQAISLFGTVLAEKPPAPAEASLQQLKRELAAASRLFENAYALQSGWAAANGLNMDGSPANGFYTPTGEWTNARPISEASENWQG